MPGAIAANFHTGSRSEVLADYLFSSWGTVTPVRRQSDYGVDLYCTLTTRSGQRGLVQEYYVVQVKSDRGPWLFDDPESVAWLVQHPAPLFLACVDKEQGVLCVYHLMPRFMVWAHEYHPERLELTPGDGDTGDSVQWKDGVSFSLSAPILRATLGDLVNESRLTKLRSVLESWIRLDRDNCDLVRAGLPRFRMPPSYHTNEEPEAATVIEMGSLLADPRSRRRGIVASAEAAEWIGGQLMNEGDREGALYAALLVSHIRQRYDDAFVDLPSWWSRLPGSLGAVDYELNRTIGPGGDELWRGIEAAAKLVRSLAELRAYYLDKE